MRSKSGFEVDFLLNDQLAIVVKAKENIAIRDLKGILALKEEKLVDKFVVISLEKRARVVEGVHILPWASFLEDLWSGKWKI